MSNEAIDPMEDDEEVVETRELGDGWFIATCPNTGRDYFYRYGANVDDPTTVQWHHPFTTIEPPPELVTPFNATDFAGADKGNKQLLDAKATYEADIKEAMHRLEKIDLCNVKKKLDLLTVAAKVKDHEMTRIVHGLPVSS